ncbi:DUF4227 family protein [Sporolactobacillus sp. STCC-11]|uniref:DUF4227 family protein n=1 Tax=Sporolactobacillus caesalpiniae TaxID=3230362 RepID=UPI003399C166
MNDIFRMSMDFFKLLIAFAVLTAAFYAGMTWVDHFQEKVHRYDEPGSGAVKVIHDQDAKRMDGDQLDNRRDYSRFIEFLRDGE